MNKSPETIKREQEESKRLMDEYFAKGGKVTVCEPFAKTENVPTTGAFFGKKKKQQ